MPEHTNPETEEENKSYGMGTKPPAEIARASLLLCLLLLLLLLLHDLTCSSESNEHMPSKFGYVLNGEV